MSRERGGSGKSAAATVAAVAADIDSKSRIEVLVGIIRRTAGRNRGGMRPDRARFADYPVLDDDRGKRWMARAGRVLRFWMAVFGLVVGLQSAGIPARSDDLQGIETPAGEARFQPDLLIKDVAGHPRDGFVTQVSEASPDTQASEVSAEKEEVSAERERDHGARSPQEMLAWLLKGAAVLTAMVLFYKGLKWWVLRKRESE